MRLCVEEVTRCKGTHRRGEIICNEKKTAVHTNCATTVCDDKLKKESFSNFFWPYPRRSSGFEEGENLSIDICCRASQVEKKKVVTMKRKADSEPPLPSSQS